MFWSLHLFIFYNFMLWKPCGSQYATGTAQRVIGKINKLTREIVIDASSKIESVQHFKSQSAKSTAYQYGYLLYQMRDRYKRMILVYNKALHNVNVEDPDNHMNAVAEMDYLAHDVLNYAAMIEQHEQRTGNKGYGTSPLRTNDIPVWQRLVESEDNHSPQPPPQENNTDLGKRKNGVWHYAVTNAFDK